MTWILDKFKSWNFHGICQENDGTFIVFGVIFDRTPVKKKWENIKCHTLYREVLMYFNGDPVKNVTWILMEIPCHFLSQIDGSLVQIHTKFYDYSQLFILVLFVLHAQKWDGFWTSSSHGIFMAFAEKMMGFPSDLVSFPTKLSSKRHEKIPVTFFTGYRF